MSDELTLSKEDIIEIFNEEKANNPDKQISRDYFSKIVPRKVYEEHFGSFNNLKTYVGDRPTKTALKEQKSFEKHKSVETLKDFNEIKFSLGDKYRLHDNHVRFKRILVGSDLHDLRCDPFYEYMFKQAARDNKPHKIILNGDILDLPEFSSYSSKLSEFRLKDRIYWLHKFLSDLRFASPKSDIEYIEGNHEYRVIHHLLEKTPAFEELVDMCDFNISKLLGLDKYQVNFYSRADIGTFTSADINNELKKNHYIAYDNVVFYHYPEGRTRFGMPGVSGHHHKYQVWPMYNHTYGTYNWMQLGAGSVRSADFTDSSYCWQNGFAQIVVDIENKKNILMEYIDCTGEFCKLNGKIYGRDEYEKKYMSNM